MPEHTQSPAPLRAAVARRAALTMALAVALALAACTGRPSAVPDTPAAAASPVPSATPAPAPTAAPAAETPTPGAPDGDADALRLRALAEVARGDVAAALESADRAVELAPAGLEAHDARAYVRLIAGQHRQAYAEYEFILDQGARPATALLGAGLAAAALGDAHTAESLLTEGLQLARAGDASLWEADPQLRFLASSASATLLAQHAPALADAIRAGRLDDALELLDQIETWAWGRDLAFACEQRAAIHASRAEYEPAVDLLTRAIEIEPTARRYASLGQALYYLGMHLDALRAYSTAIRLDPDNVQLYEDRAFINAKADQFDRALVDLDHAIGLAPDNPSLHALRGEAHYHLGNTEAAIADFRTTLELNPADADAALARERLAELAPAP